jgi:DNA-binding MurR/RpiR family transcriptional regulator
LTHIGFCFCLIIVGQGHSIRSTLSRGNEAAKMDHTWSLEERIAASLDRLSPKQKQLARFLLDNKYLVSFSSASHFGKSVGASAATVVRFAQSLGYAGFSELRSAIRKELPTYLTAAERIEKRLAAPPSPGDIPQQVFHTEISNIERTASSLDIAQLNAVLDAIVQARRILIVGCGLSAAPVWFLAHSLKVIGFNVRKDIDGGLSLATEIAQLRPATLLVAIDLWRYTRSTVEGAYAARARGAQVVAITDSVMSPLAQAADYVFEVATDGTGHSLSPTAVISLLNVFIAALSYRVPDQIMESLRRVDTMYRTHNLLLTE